MKDSLKLNIDSITKKVKDSEANNLEFKANFDNNRLWMYAKTMAAFANRDGGVIFFGIKDNSKDLLGVPENQLDDTTISNFTKAYFEPEIVFDIGYKKYDGINLFYILVQPCKNKPVICKTKKTLVDQGKSNKEVLREGAIYYRYSTSTVDIEYTALREILDNSVKKAISDFIDKINLVKKIGHDRLVVVDEDVLNSADKTTPVYITDKTAEKMNWVHENQIVKSGDTGDRVVVVTGETKLAVGIEKPVDFSKTHTLILRSLAEHTLINPNYVKPVLWKLGLLEKQPYHIATKHGKIFLHKFTVKAKDELLKHYPLDMPNRLEQFIEINKEYNLYKKGKAK